MKNICLDEIVEKRDVWLEQFDLKSSDIMDDDKGEYILQEFEVGEPAVNGYGTEFKKIYLPVEFQLN